MLATLIIKIIMVFLITSKILLHYNLLKTILLVTSYQQQKTQQTCVVLNFLSVKLHTEPK